MNELLMAAAAAAAAGPGGYLVGRVRSLALAQRQLPSVVCHSCDYRVDQVPWFLAISRLQHHTEHTHHQVELVAGT